MTDTIEPTEEQKQAARLHFYAADDHIDDATTLALARLLAEREHRLREELSGLDALDATMSDLVERASLESDMSETKNSEQGQDKRKPVWVRVDVSSIAPNPGDQVMVSYGPQSIILLAVPAKALP